MCVCVCVYLVRKLGLCGGSCAVWAELRVWVWRLETVTSTSSCWVRRRRHYTSPQDVSATSTTTSNRSRDQWRHRRANNGSVGQQIWEGHVGHGSVPVTHFTLYSSGIPRDFLVHGKPATAMETVILTISICHKLCISVARDEQTTSETHRFPWEGPNSVKILVKKD